MEFVKAHGTGNDFVVVSDDVELDESLVRALCDRRFGIGADGVIRLAREDELWFMDYWNADGSIAEMCGNGVRVFVHVLARQGRIALSDDETIVVRTRAGDKRVRLDPFGYAADLGPWTLTEDLVRVGFAPATPTLFVDLGNPHVVVPLPDDAMLQALDLSHAPALEPALASGANVEFAVRLPDPAPGLGHVRMRVHERGSGETLSCGTGAVATALASRHWAEHGAASRGGAAHEVPASWLIDVPGGRLRVDLDGEHVWLAGPAEVVFAGEWPGALTPSGVSPEAL